MHRRKSSFIVLTAIIWLLVSCGGSTAEPAAQPVATEAPAIQEPTPEPTVAPAIISTAPAAAEAEVVSPEESPLCSPLAAEMEQRLSILPTVNAAVSITDYVTGQTGTGCQITASGSGVDFADVGVIYDAFDEMFQNAGWQADINYEGGGPTGLMGGYRFEQALCMWVAEWEPAENANCPDDQPIDACDLTPEQMLYTIAVNCLEGTAVTQPPAEVAESLEVLPLDVPVGFEFLFGLDGSFMLPPDFPVEEGLPAIQPHVIVAEPGEYEISLEYGTDCHGAGACRYGSLAGKWIASMEPESFGNFVFEPDQAQMVELAQGIKGYFIEANCGANCDDAKLFWVYDGFEYVLGLKGGQQEDLVDLANAAILNSLHSN